MALKTRVNFHFFVMLLGRSGYCLPRGSSCCPSRAEMPVTKNTEDLGATGRGKPDSLV